jgi:hypothetical protein
MVNSYRILRASSLGIHEKGSGEKTMDDIYVSDDELHVPFLPQVSPLADDPLIFFM